MNKWQLSNSENAALHFYLVGNFLLFDRAISILECEDAGSPIYKGLLFAKVGNDESKIYRYWSGDDKRERRLSVYNDSYGQIATELRQSVDAIQANMWASVFAEEKLRLIEIDNKRMNRGATNEQLRLSRTPRANVH